MAEPVLKKGSTDPGVRDLQKALKALGQDPGPVDGLFGAKTEAAVKAFQNNQEITVDGIVGPLSAFVLPHRDAAPSLSLAYNGGDYAKSWSADHSSW